MRVGVFNHIASSGVETAQRILLVRGVPNHAVAIDTDCVRAPLGAGQGEFLERLRLGIEAANLVAAALGEPDDAVRIYFEALWFAFGRRVEFREHPVLGDAPDGSIVAERREPLITVVTGSVAISSAEVVVAELLSLRVEHRDRRPTAHPHEAAIVYPNGV